MSMGLRSQVHAHRRPYGRLRRAMAAVENGMRKLTDIAVVLVRYDERILAVTTRLNPTHNRWEELRQSRNS